MKPATKAELRDKLIDRYQAFTKWVLRQSPEIEELTLVKDYLKEIDVIEAQIRASEQGSSPVEQPINTNIKTYICTDCKAVNYLSDNGEIRVGFCNQCGHPLWNPSQVERPTASYMRIIEQSDDEKLAMYMKCKKEELAKMLIQCNKLLDMGLITGTVYSAEQPTEKDYCSSCVNYDNDDICNKCDDAFCMYKTTEIKTLEEILYFEVNEVYLIKCGIKDCVINAMNIYANQFKSNK